MIPEPQKTYLLELLTTLDPAADEFVLVGGQALKFAFCWASINVMAKWLFVQSSPILSTIPSCRLRQLFQSRERGQGVKLTLQDNTLKIASKSTETGESEEVLESVYSKEPVVIGFNASYLLDIFKALGGKATSAWSSRRFQQRAPPSRGLQSRVHVVPCADAATGLSRR